MQTHLCFTIDAFSNVVTLYLNGIQAGVSNIANSEPVLGGGYLVLGQDHDRVSFTDPDFKQSQAFR